MALFHQFILGLVVLEVFNEIFEDVIDSSLYTVAALTRPVYDIILNATATQYEAEHQDNPASFD